MRPITAILIGAGQRGIEVFGDYALRHPGKISFVAVAEPDMDRRTRFARQHGIQSEMQFSDWQDLLHKPLLADVALICTPDRLHTAPSLAALERGYDILLEKPMATTLSECRQIVRAAENAGQHMLVAHGLRYTKHFSVIRQMIQSGTLGEIINVDHRENVSYWHMAHSYVRGNWRNTAESAPMILAKCCHDLDVLVWMLGDTCRTMSSTGSLKHYRPDKAPAGATQYCMDGCPAADSCPFFAPMIYADYIPLLRNIAHSADGLLASACRLQLHSPALTRAIAAFVPAFRKVSQYRAWPGNIVSPDGVREHILENLKTSPYGRCVYHCDNDVVDNQVVNMVFNGGATVTLSMHGHSHDEGRTTRIQGSRAELYAEFLMAGSWVEVRDHRTGRRNRIDTTFRESSGHGGGDEFLMESFIRQAGGDTSAALSTPRLSLESHLMAFAAEDARIGQKVIHMDDYRS